MKPDAFRDIPRREFLKLAGAAGVYELSPTRSAAAVAARACSLIDSEDANATSVASMKAVARLAEALGAKGVRHEVVRSVEATEGAEFCVVLAHAESHLAKSFAHGEPGAVA
ncbi:MAG TPA: hypothetical protein VGJ21_11685, partial [Terracidiphilus sp.]